MKHVEFEIEIPLDGGEPKEHIKGIPGMDCLSISDMLFGGLGDITHQELTEEASQQIHNNPQFLNQGMG